MAIELIPLSLIAFFMLYGAAAVLVIIACIYLLLRRGNAFAADVTTAVRLRRWVVAFYAMAFLSHVWWIVFLIISFDGQSATYVVVAILDMVTLVPTVAGTQLYMLQDRKRPIWPMFLAMIPCIVLGALQIHDLNGNYLRMENAYIIAVYLSLTVYMVFAVRQYGRWLRDNYADLERKEVWQTQVAVTLSLMVFVIYWMEGDSIILGYLLQFTQIWLFGVLLWRVETLPMLDSAPAEQDAAEVLQQQGRTPQTATTLPSNIGQLLTVHCVDTQLYLQHGLTLAQLAKAVGTNRFYLSQYFAGQGLTYNAYINGLRIKHFVSRYHQAVSSCQPFTAQQLANDSGYRSYSTFSLAFKQRMGQSVTTWMRNQ
jgi:AraC-like DNA-binding protein